MGSISAGSRRSAARILLLAAALILLLAPMSLGQNASTLPAVEIFSDTKIAIRGRDVATGINFSAVLHGATARIEAELRGKRITAEIDYRRQSVRLKSTSISTGRASELEQRDIAAFQEARNRVVERINRQTQLSDALISFFELIGSAPAGVLSIP